ncbi:HD-GYP domain-containing protein [Sporosarcina sp. 179-K 3D1 HS]|uniref:HD-GYP domain-containing protein n=1 Tax=Sporosarcina sp. 179-K 3D1 HS TaxID=3232169 RepID=UPI0039A2EA4D
MAETYTDVSDLRPGFILSEDVFVNTKDPIVRKGTMLVLEHFEILRAFGIRKVKVEERVQINKEETVSAETLSPDDVLTIIPMEKLNLQEQYDSIVQSFRKEFLSWRAGLKPDIAKVRTLVLPLVETFMEQKKMLTVLNEFSNSKDYLYHHSIAVGILAAMIGKQLDFPKGQVLQLGLAGVLADCGMAKIDRSITEKAAFLTKDEFNEVKKHTIYSYQMVQETQFLRPEMKMAIFQHHERLDGSGYPKGIKMNDISTFSQILAVADVFHAMTSERIYRKHESPFKVIEMIKEEEFGKFDIKVVQALHDLVANITIGTKVKLTNGDVGEVIFVHRDARLRPMVRKNDDESIIDLTTNRHLAIERVLE